MKLFKSIGIFFIISIFSKLFGFVREIITAYYFGTSLSLDAFLMASMIPLLLFDGVGAALSTGLIPILSESKFENIDKRNEFISSLLIVLTAGLTVFTILFVLITPLLTSIIAPGFDHQMINIVNDYTKIMMPIIICSGIAYILMAFLQFEGYYNGASIMGISTSISIILFVIIGYKYLNAYALVLGTLAGSILQILIFIPYLKRYYFKFSWKFKISQTHKKLLMFSLPVLAGSLIIQINITVDRMLASKLEAGSISALNYSSKLNTLILGTTIMALSTVVFPLFAKLWANSQKHEFSYKVSNSIKGLTFIMLPMCMFLSILSFPIIRVLFERGAFDQAATDLTAKAFTFSVLILIGLSIREILNKALYSMKDTKGPFVGTATLVTSNVILALIFVPQMGIIGLPLATGIGNFIAVAVIYSWIKRKHSISLFNYGKKSYFIMFISSSLVSLILYFVVNQLINFPVNKVFVVAEILLLLVSSFIVYLLINLLLGESITKLLPKKLYGLITRLERKRVTFEE